MAAKLILGCGYLGRRVAALWRDAGHSVFATTRKATRFAELRSVGIEPVSCDVLDRRSLSELPAVETLLYCVGMDRAEGHSMRNVYVGGLANVLDALEGRPPTRFFYISSTSVYGQADGQEVDESSATEPKEESGRIVLEAEQLLRKRLPTAIVLRFAGIYGPDRMLRAKALLAGEPIVGDADKWLNLIRVEDGAAAVVTADERAAAGATYNISDGQPVRRRDFYAWVARQLGAPPPVFVAPAVEAEAERVNRRIGNRRMLEELGVVIRQTRRG